jgi:TnsA endonuclease N terminal
MSFRKPSNKGGVKKYIGKFPSFRLNMVIWFESLLERDFLCLLEYDFFDVKFFKSQPCRIHYRSDGKKRRYTPDFLVIRNSKRQIIEVKPEEKALEQKNRALYRIAAQTCAKEGYEFRVVTDVEIRVEPRLDNIKLLLRYQRTLTQPQHQIYCQEFFGGRRNATLQQVMEFFEGKDVEKQVVYSLIRWGALGVDLMEPIGADSLVFLPGNHSSGEVR